MRFVLALVCFLFSPLAIANEYQSAVEIFKQSPESAEFFESAYGYALFPSIGKGGIVVGGAYGTGQVYRGGALTGKASMAQLSVGWQLGGEVYSEIVFFEDKAAYDTFTSGNFEFTAQAQAVAITVGAQAKAGTTGASAGASLGSRDKQLGGVYENGMAVFTHVKGGLMYEASIAGQKFSYETL